MNKYHYEIKGEGAIILRDKNFTTNILPKLSDREIKLYLFICNMSGPTTLKEFEEKFNATDTDVYYSLKKLYDYKLINAEKDGNLLKIYLGGWKEKTGSGKETADLVKSVEKLTGKPVSTSEIASLLYIKEDLKMPEDVIMYLVEYCLKNNALNSKYMEKVATAWIEKDIYTVEQAKQASHRYDPRVYEIMQSLGQTDPPAPVEAEMIEAWTNSLNMPKELIEEACRKTVLAGAKGRVAYADKILKAWKEKGFTTVSDVKNEPKHGQAQQPKQNEKIRFKLEREYDFDDLEESLLKKQHQKKKSRQC